MLAEKLQEAAGNGLASTLYVDDVFSTWLYTGTGAAQTITNGIDLSGQGGMTWIKSRSAATDHKLTDTARGATKALISDTTGAQTTDANGLTAFSSTGFSIGTDSVYNTNAATYASWTFRKAAKFFDVVTWTGNGVAGRQIAHSLGIAPGMMIVKVIDQTSNWSVYHRSINGNGNGYMFLNTTAAAYSSGNLLWGNGTDFIAPTATNFTIGSDSFVNYSGYTYVAYLFAHDTSANGIIQCGSYTGNGANGQSVNIGWEPQWLLIKRTDTTANWMLQDSMRPFGVSVTEWLNPNTSNAESGGGVAYVSPTATGFTFTSGGSAAYNANGATYIYMAIRRPNKPPTSGTQVFSPVYEGSTTPAVQTPFVVDMGISKRKDLASDVLMGSRLQGSRKMWTNLTNAESADANYTWDYQNGYKTNTGVSTGYNINWSFKRAPGFFDVVCYTGSSSSRNQAHNLGVAPEMIIVKPRTLASSWQVWVTGFGLGGANNLQLDSNSSTYQNNGLVTSSGVSATTFSLAGDQTVNNSAYTYVAYLFATLAGISKVGSYTGNGSTQTINCGFTGGARFVLIKRTDSTGDWYVFDTTRGMTTLTDPYLLLNSTAAEVATLGAVTSVTTGFAVNAAIVAAINTNAASYIYLSVA